MASIQDLRTIKHFANLPEEELTWLAQVGEEVQLNRGEVLFEQDEAVAHLMILLQGSLQLVRLEGGQESASFSIREGELTGIFPFSRMKHHRATATALESMRVVKLHKQYFRDLRDTAPELEQCLVGLMSDRIREFTQLDQQREKLIALGKLSAGLAHELNNPAAANRRAASQLRNALTALQTRLHDLLGQGVPAEQLADLAKLQTDVLAMPPARLGALELSEREDELTDWLEDQDVKEAWSLAPTFAHLGLTPQHLDAAIGHLGGDTLSAALSWLEASLNAESLIQEVEESSKRISELVKSVKDYTYMDQTPLQELNVHDGLESTLTMLGHKLRDIMVQRDYDPSLPKIQAYGSELNQVWTNLIDNAVDAMEGHGTLRLRTSQEKDMVLIDIIDNGPGIPPDVQPRIFEPFFTTKGVGKGSGLGLDISHRIVARRHRGSIRFTSKPGETHFMIRLPLSLSSRD